MNQPQRTRSQEEVRQVKHQLEEWNQQPFSRLKRMAVEQRVAVRRRLWAPCAAATLVSMATATTQHRL